LGKVVAVSEDIDDVTLDEVENCYEALQRDQETRLDACMGDGRPGRTRTPLTVQLASGQAVCASVPSHRMRRLLTVYRPEEMGQLVDAIAMAGESPDLRPICRR
jgi:hypothetical protein